MKLFSSFIFYFFILIGNSSTKAATYSSSFETSIIVSESTTTALNQPKVEDKKTRKLTFKEKIILSLLKSKIKKSERDSTTKETPIAGNSGFGLSLGSLIGWVLALKFIFKIGVGVALLLSLLGLGASIYALILGIKYGRMTKKDPEKYPKSRFVTTIIFSVLGIMFWGEVAILFYLLL